MLASRRIYWPAINLIGPGCVAEVGAEVAKLGLRKALVVTDPVLAAAGVTSRVTDSLAAAGVPFALYDRVQPNPTVRNVEEGLETLRREGCDFLVSVGGGSPQDTASAISILATNGGKVQDYEGIFKSSRRGLPVVAVNTTAGTAVFVNRKCPQCDPRKGTHPNPPCLMDAPRRSSSWRCAEQTDRIPP